MKKQKPFILSFLLLQVFLLSAANNSFAFSNSSIDLGSRQGEFFSTDQNEKAVIFEENVSSIDFQTSSENEDEPHSFQFNFYLANDLPELYSAKNNFSEFEPNRKNILKTRIFPFHFFW